MSQVIFLVAGLVFFFELRALSIPGHYLCYYEDNWQCCDMEPLGFCYNSQHSVYKVLTPQEWKGFQKSGLFQGSVDDQRDGFIHLSKPNEQLDYVLTNFFAGKKVVIIEIDTFSLGKDLRWEAGFPHLYRIPLSLKHIRNYSPEGVGFELYEPRNH